MSLSAKTRENNLEPMSLSTSPLMFSMPESVTNVGGLRALTACSAALQDLDSVHDVEGG